jgi:hypothetical protein
VKLLPLLLLLLAATARGEVPGEAAYRRALFAETAERNLETASRFYHRALRELPPAHPLRTDALYRRARCEDALSHPEEAAAAYRDFLAASPPGAPERILEARRRLESLAPPPQPLPAPPSPTPNGAVHRVTFFTLALVGNPGEKETRRAGGGEILAYECIHPRGWGLRLAPVNLYAWEGVLERSPSGARDRAALFSYAPLGVRYYLRRGSRRRTWPFLGAAPAYQIFDDRGGGGISDTSGFRFAGEAGVDFGRGLFQRHTLALKWFAGRNVKADTGLMALSYGYSFGFQNLP